MRKKYLFVFIPLSILLYSFSDYKTQEQNQTIIGVRYLCDDINEQQKELLSDFVKVLNCHSLKQNSIFSFSLTCKKNNSHEYRFFVEFPEDVLEYSFDDSMGQSIGNKMKILKWEQKEKTEVIITCINAMKQYVEAAGIYFKIDRMALNACMKELFHPILLDQTWWNKLSPTWQKAYHKSLSKITKTPASQPNYQNLEKLFDLTKNELDLSSCKLTDLSGLETFRSKKITNLYLSKNKLQSLDELKHHPTIVRLYLQGNRLRYTDIELLLRGPNSKKLKLIRVGDNPGISDEQIEKLNAINHIDVIK